jgi:Holliday junction resolvase RusA-like endonuclease
MIYPITPCPKPRMTQRDKWLKCDATRRYWAFCEQVKLYRVELTYSGADVTFRLPMPNSWSKKRKDINHGTAHQQRPDLDNLIKALCDAIYQNDACVWEITARKIWADEGSIEIL